MREGEFNNADVVTLTRRVLVSGIEREFHQWETDREIVGDLPSQVAGGHGINSAGGTIVWKEQPPVTDRAVNPWNAGSGWLPKSGEQVVIRVSDGTTEWTQFTGVIDKTTSSVGGAPRSTVVDYFDWLNRPFNHSTLLRLHPPRNEGEAYRGIGLSPAYLVDRLWRRAGFFATPPMDPGVVMSAPLQTSTWPEWGILTEAGSLSGTTHGTNYRAPWGWSLADFTATYTPQGEIPRLGTDPLQISGMVAPDHVGSFTMNVYFGSYRIHIWVNTGRAVVASINGGEVLRLSLAGATTFSLLVKNDAWQLRTDLPGRFATGTKAVPAGAALSSIVLSADSGARIAGLQVSKPTPAGELQAISHTPTAYQESGTLLGIQDAMPSIVGRSVIDVLEEISRATLAPFWFDERGVLVMYGSDVLRGRAPMQTITTLDDITTLSWEDSRLSTRSGVTVKYRYPAINRSRYTNILLWQGSGETMVSGQVKELFASEPADEDWAEVDVGLVALAEGMVAFNAGRGTWLSSYLEDKAGVWSSSSGYVTWESIRTIDDETRLLKVTAGVLPAGKSLVLGTPDDAAAYNPRMRGMDMPVLRGRARVKWADMRLTSAITGPGGFPHLDHEVGPWSVQVDEIFIQQRIADFIARQVTTPQPIITGMGVTFDPRRQLGDVVTVRSNELLGAELRCLVIGVHNADSPDRGLTQALDVRVISATAKFVTYDQLAAAWGSGNYASLEAAWAALNYAAMASNPLEVSP